MNKFMMISLMFAFVGCASQTILPEKDSVKITREAPDKDCKKIGKVSGASLSVKATKDQVLSDLKQDAANKGANYVVIKQWSDNGTNVTGIGYQCN